MAEAFANLLGEGRIRAYSAGTDPLGEISEGTSEVLREKGIGLDGYWSKGLKDVPLSDMNVVVKMGYGIRFPIPRDFSGRLIQWNIPDPYLHDLDFFRAVRDLIEEKVREMLADLAADSRSS